MYKYAKRLVATLLTLVMALSLCACGGAGSNSGASSAPAAPGYTVSVVDGLGNPYTEGVIVRFMQGTTQVSMEVIGADGTVTKDLEKGDYTVELMFTDAEAVYYYDTTDLTLSADKTQLEIVLTKALSGEPQQLHVNDPATGESGTHDAYAVEAGSTFVSLKGGQRNYFLFTPTEGGTYQFSLTGNEGTVGYYGAPHFVQSMNAGTEQEGGSVTVSVRPDMIGGAESSGTSVLVIGVDVAEGVESATLNIIRIGDHEWSPADEPWTIYTSVCEKAPYVAPAGVKLNEFDLTADSVNLVLGEDGYYHLDSADGPLVVVMLGENPGYVDCFKTILDHTGVVKYFFDEDNNFIKKERYSDCLVEYLEVMDQETGLYPLNDDLMYIIQQAGDQLGWYEEGGSTYIFKDANGNIVPGINAEISWLFMCRTIDN